MWNSIENRPTYLLKKRQVQSANLNQRCPSRLKTDRYRTATAAYKKAYRYRSATATVLII
jgi:hypothetical protein